MSSIKDIVEIVRSKGTMRSIKSVFMSTGINPKKGFRFREFGGNRFAVLSDVREDRERFVSRIDYIIIFSNHNYGCSNHIFFVMLDHFIPIICFTRRLLSYLTYINNMLIIIYMSIVIYIFKILTNGN